MLCAERYGQFGVRQRHAVHQRQQIYLYAVVRCYDSVMVNVLLLR